ncbi:hypothetical protein [Mycobacterium sp. UM_CSW]|uniref:hypothetical protein n=1 Tax=Mycobacterium sp. UM_CSW TaxID=1370119 RepID=UPI00082ACF0E
MKPTATGLERLAPLNFSGQPARMRSAEERDMSLALRSGQGNRLGKAVGWYHSDMIISRHNDATLAVEPGEQHRRVAPVDQVRNGNRWRVACVDARRRNSLLSGVLRSSVRTDPSPDTP